jgi:hypothetical protein
MTTFVSIAGSEFPAELVRKVRNDAEVDADCVAMFLDRLGLGRKNPEDPPARFPAAFLLGLGAVLRVLGWEVAGYYPHKEGGLSSARQMLLDLLKWCQHDTPAQRDRAVVQLCNKILSISATRFAWEGPEIIGVDVLIGPADEDVLVDAMAEFVWQSRHLFKGNMDEQT